MRAWLAWTWVLGLTLACHSSHPPETPPPADAGYVFPYSLPLCTGPEEQPVTLTLESYVPLATPSSWNRGASSSELEPGPAQDERRRTLVPDTDGEQPPPLDLYDVWAVSPTDVWVVGAYGTAAHFDGTRWTLTPTGTDVSLRGVSGTSDTDVWAVGEWGTVLHWDGQAWSGVETGHREHLIDVFSGAGEWAVVVGEQGLILRLGGNGWQRLPSSAEWTLTAVWARGPGDIWASSTIGSAFHWFQGKLVEADGPEETFPKGQWALWGLYQTGGVLAPGRWRNPDGVWQPLDVGTWPGSNQWRGAWQAPSGDVWLALSTTQPQQRDVQRVVHTTGTCWDAQQIVFSEGEFYPLDQLFAIHGAGAHEAWAVGSRGKLFHLRY